MFKITELTVKDWCQHKNRTVKFVAGTNGVIGTNGKGKSNLVNAIFTAITGRVITDTIEDNINFEADKAIIDLQFTQDGIAGTLKRAFTATRTEDPKIRKTTTSTAKLTYGDLNISGASKVTEALGKITGMSPRVIEDHIFVSQNRMQELLFQTKADRMASFLTLIPGVDRAETLRDVLQAELIKYPEITLAFDMATIKSQVDANVIEQSCIKQDVEAVERELKSIKIADIFKFESELTEITQAEGRLNTVTTATNQLGTQVEDLFMAQVNADKQLADFCNVFERCKSTAEVARAELKNIEQNKTIFTTRKRVNAELAMLMSDITTRGTPDDGGKPWTKLPALETTLSQLMAEIAEHDKVLRLLNLGNNCPTCGKPFDNAEAERTTHKTALAEATGKLVTVRNEVTNLKSAERVYNTAMANHVAWVESAQQRMTSLTDTLKTLPEVAEPDVARVTGLTALVNECDAAAYRVGPAEAASKRAHEAYTSANSRFETLKEQAIELTELVAKKPAAIVIAANNALHARYDELTSKQSMLTGKLEAKEEEHARLAQTLLTIETMAAKAVATRDYRTLITNVREVLHRDRLPNEVLVTYIQELDMLCNKFLGMFGNPFTVQLGRDMELTCRFPNGYTCDAGRLSGGQKCVLSLAVRFSINELFAKDLGLICLDEPTHDLDVDHVAYVGELMEYIKKVGKAAGVQTIVVTHDMSLMPCFESVINLNES